MFEKYRSNIVEIKRFVTLFSIVVILAACSANPSMASSSYEYIIACIDSNNSGECDDGDLPVPEVIFEIRHPGAESENMITDENGKIKFPVGTIGFGLNFAEGVPEGLDLKSFGSREDTGIYHFIFDYTILQNQESG